MKKILIIISLFSCLFARAQTVNRFRDSTWQKGNFRIDSKLLYITEGAGNLKVLTSDDYGRATWQTFSSAGVTQGALDDSISDVRAIRKVDTIYKNLDSIVFKINGIRYSVLDSTGGGMQTLSISGDTLSISGGNSVTLPVYVQVDSATVTSYDVLNSQNAPPVSPNVGDVYLVGNTPSGAWVGHAKDIAEWNGSAWVFTDGVQGNFLYNSTTALTYIFRSGNWVQTTGIPALNNGNTISSGLKIGTNNARSLRFETANLERGRIDSIGRYYIYDTSLRYGNKYVQVDSLTGRLIATEIPSNDGFIPLRGTEVGSPVTGDVDMSDLSMIKNVNQTRDNGINFEGDLTRIGFWNPDDYQYKSGGVLTTSSLSVAIAVRDFSLNEASIQCNSVYGIKVIDNIFNRGLTSNYDFTANIDSLDYTQKKYVDSRISDTATQIRSEMPDVSNLATITNLADTSTALRSLISAKVSTTTLTDSLSTKTNKLISFNTYTTSDTLRLSDADKVIEMNVGTANNLVIPNYSDYAFPVGTQITVIQIGSGQTTFVPASGVTISSAGGKLKLTGQYSTASLIKRSNTLWYLFGDITN